MKSAILLLFLATIPNLVQPFDCKTFDASLKKIASDISTPLENTIKKKLTSLKQEAILIKNGALWENISQQLEIFKKTSEYISIYKLQEALNLLDSLDDHSLLRPQAELLDAISSLLQSATMLDRPYKSFFLKERARLMDGADEAIILKTKQASILELKTSLLKKLQKEIKKIKSLELYQSLQKSHQKYLSDKKTKKAATLIDKIRTLEREKAMLLATNKQLLSIQNQKHLLLAQTKTPFFEPPKNSDNELNFIQLDLLIAPLEVLIL